MPKLTYISAQAYSTQSDLTYPYTSVLDEITVIRNFTHNGGTYADN
jgi:hypothetical protein